MFGKKTIIALILFTAFSVTLIAQESGRHLIIRDLTLTPNPFSPNSAYSVRDDEKGMRINFTVETHSTFVWITARIFNTRGHLVRTIKEWEPVYSDKRVRGPEEETTEIDIWWDGKTDYGRIAQNGRYILHLHFSDTEARTFSTEETRTFVLIK